MSKSARLVIATAPTSPRSTRGSAGPSATARNGEAVRCGHGGQPPRQPAVRRALHAGRARLHVVLRVEVRARGVGRAAGVHRGEPPLVPERLERRQRRMQAEEAVEIDGAVAARRARDRDAAARARSSRGRRAARACSGRPRPRAGRSRPAPSTAPRATGPAPSAPRSRGDRRPCATSASAPPFTNDRRVHSACMRSISSGTPASRARAPPASRRRCRWPRGRRRSCA